MMETVQIVLRRNDVINGKGIGWRKKFNLKYLGG